MPGTQLWVLSVSSLKKQPRTKQYLLCPQIICKWLLVPMEAHFPELVMFCDAVHDEKMQRPPKYVQAEISLLLSKLNLLNDLSRRTPSGGGGMFLHMAPPPRKTDINFPQLLENAQSVVVPAKRQTTVAEAFSRAADMVLGRFTSRRHEPEVKPAYEDRGSWSLHHDMREAMRALLGAGAKIHELDDSGKTPLYYTLTGFAKEAFEYLLTLGADMDYQPTAEQLECLECLAAYMMPREYAYYGYFVVNGNHFDFMPDAMKVVVTQMQPEFKDTFRDKYE